MKSFLKRHSLIIGLVMMFLYTWTIDLSNSGILLLKVPSVVALTVGWGFIFVSLLMTWLTLGKDTMSALFMRYFLWRVGWKCWLVALFLSPVLQFASVLLANFRSCGLQSSDDSRFCPVRCAVARAHHLMDSL